MPRTRSSSRSRGTSSSRRSSARRASSRSRRAAPSRGSTSRSRSSSRGRRYGPRTQGKVREAMHEMKRGQLRSGRSGKRVSNPKQAIAIGLSEARRAGDKVPPRGRRSRRSRS